MNKTSTFFSGILGVSLFAIASILGGFQFDDYNPISQFISETMAIDTPYGKTLRFFGYIPAGILLTIFSFSAMKKFPQSKLIKIGFLGFAIFYGIATIIVGIFPCDKGCNKELIEPSASQLIHNLTGLLTYVFVPISILLIGVGLRKFENYHGLSAVALICGAISILFIGILFSNPLTSYGGLYQRIVEATFILWIIACANFIRKKDLVIIPEKL